MKLKIKRNRAFVACAMTYRIFVNGNECGRLRNGDEMTIEVPDTQFALRVDMVGNALNFHKLEKEIVVFPEKCNTDVVCCEIRTESKMLGVLTGGIFAAVGKIHLDINY